jgi:diacylglycerol kinase
MTSSQRPKFTKRLWQTLTGTARINPENYAAKISPNRLASLGYALAGWLYMLRWQKNTRIMSVATILVFLLGFWLGISRLEWALITIVITIVWLTEFLNAGIEAAIDVASPDYHPMAQVGKDVASAAVLLGVIASVIVGVLVFAPYLVEKIGAL